MMPINKAAARSIPIALGTDRPIADRMIPAQRIVPLKPKNDPGYYVINEDEIDRYVRSGAAAVDWSPPLERRGQLQPQLEGDRSYR
jgi:hypothetical protein